MPSHVTRSHCSFLRSQRHAGPIANSSTSAGIVGREAARLDITNLGTAVWELFNAGLAQLILRSYKSGCDKYVHVRVCAEERAERFPASEESASLFVASLYRKGLAGGVGEVLSSGNQVLADSFGSGRPKDGRVALTGLRCERVQEESSGPQEEASFPNYFCSVAETEEGV